MRFANQASVTVATDDDVALPPTRAGFSHDRILMLPDEGPCFLRLVGDEPVGHGHAAREQFPRRCHPVSTEFVHGQLVEDQSPGKQGVYQRHRRRR